MSCNTDGDSAVKNALETKPYFHGHIVSTAAEHRLEKALNSLGGGSVWLVRHEAGSSKNPDKTRLILSCMVQYADGRHTSHYLIDGSDSDGKFHLVDSNASDASEHQSFASVEQLLTAYKIPEYGIAPAPLGLHVPRDARQLWSPDGAVREHDTYSIAEEDGSGNRDSSVHATRFEYKCTMCDFHHGTIATLKEHVSTHTDQERALRYVLQDHAGGFYGGAIGVHVAVQTVDGVTTVSATSGYFVVVRCMRTGRAYHYSHILFGNQPLQWAYQDSSFVPLVPDTRGDGGGLGGGGDGARQQIAVELWYRRDQRTDGEALVASGLLPLDGLAYGEPKTRAVPLVVRNATILGDAQPRAEVELTVARQYNPSATLTATRSGSDIPMMQLGIQELGSLHRLTTQFEGLKAKKKAKDALTLQGQLIHRLAKLLYHCPSTMSRKEFEKSIVPWVKDGLVSKCPDCAERFALHRRRHHCRLCGGIVCGACSQVIDVGEAHAMLHEIGVARKIADYADATLDNQAIAQVQLRGCGNCCKICEREHRMAMKIQSFHQMSGNMESDMAQAVSYYTVLRKGLATLQKKAHQFHEISSRLHRRECLALRAPATALLDAIVGELSVLDTVSKKLITFSTGADFEVYENIRETCVRELEKVVCGLTDLPDDTFFADAQLELETTREEAAEMMTGGIQGANTSLFEIWEVQRWHPKLWFSATALEDADWQPWSHHSGQWGYMTRSLANPQSGSVWSGPWFQDFTVGDSDGYMHARDRVRRRRWWRHMVDRNDFNTLSALQAESTPKESRGRSFSKSKIRKAKSAPVTQHTMSGREPKSTAGLGTSPKTTHPPATSPIGTVDANAVWRKAGESSSSASPSAAGGENEGFDGHGGDGGNGDDGVPSEDEFSDDYDDFDNEEEEERDANGAHAWIKDSATSKCMLCSINFNVRRRRHHCRQCGRVVCAACSKGRIAHQHKLTKSGKRKNVRTCDQCMSYSRGHGAVLPQHGAPLLDTGVEDITEPF